MAKVKDESETRVYNPANPNAHLDLGKFNYKSWTPELWAEYQEVMKSLQARKQYDFEEYNAVGVWKVVNDPITDEPTVTNILTGIRLIKDAPLKTSRIEVQHIEDWSFNPRTQRKEMRAGLNRQIYDKANPATNSRFYLLKQVKVEETVNA